VQHLHSDDAEFALEQRVDDVASRAAFNRVGLDDGKSALQCLHA
jgi:hypothetical protein